MKVYQAIAHCLLVADKHKGDATKPCAEKLRMIEREMLPSGAGCDTGTTVDIGASTVNRIVLRLHFHHMNNNGLYGRWTQHKVILTPSFIGGVDIKVTGLNYREIKNYIAEVVYHAVMDEYTFTF